MQAEELIEYQNLSTAELFERTHGNIKILSKALVSYSNQAVIVVEDGAISLQHRSWTSHLFVALRNIAADIAWQPANSEYRFRIYTLLPQHFFTPSHIIDIANWWSDEDLQLFSSQKKNGHIEPPLIVPATIDPDTVKEFLYIMYQIDPRTLQIHPSIHKAPVLYTLCILHWLKANGFKK